MYRTNGFKLCVALLLGIIVFLLPRPEGTQFKITGDKNQTVLQEVSSHFVAVPPGEEETGFYILKANTPGSLEASVKFLRQRVVDLNLDSVQVDYVDGLSPKAKRFLAILAVLVTLFVIEPIPLEITAVCIGVFLVIMGITDVKTAWAPYMHPVVIFIMCCLIFAIALDKAGLTKRLGYYIIKKAGNSITKFTFIIAIGLGLASSFMHDAAACAVGIITMLPLMRAAGIEPQTNTAKFMMLSLPFACSCGGMGTLVGGEDVWYQRRFYKSLRALKSPFFNGYYMPCRPP